jgi:succinate dehydrogenase / fumarate reductase flavoprotein subunit
MHLETDVLVIGAGGAGMYAAIEAARGGAKVILADRSLIGRGGATIMAQMTVAVALGEQEPDHWEHHYADTLAAGRGLCDPVLARLLCEEGPEVIREMDEWGVGWARQDGSRRGPMKQAFAPGHDRPRCVYVDFLNTGPAVSRTLRTRLIRTPEIRRIGDLLVTELVVVGQECVGAVALHLSSGEAVSIAAASTIVATGGLTRLYQRNSASANMSGDGYALCLAAGAELVDMEFVQFFPIGHLAPRLIGMDPIMWDPFRYKLGGRLLNGDREEFVVTRDLATYAIVKEVEAGRGSPHGGAWLSFEHCSEADLRAAAGPVIDRLAKNGIDLQKQAIEVAPIAHYHMGGVKADAAMATRVPGLFVAGEAVGGANGANRLSGNAITEALVFGRKAGRNAAILAKARRLAARGVFDSGVEKLVSGPASGDSNPAAMIEELQALMQKEVGPFRTGAGLERALARITSMSEELPAMKPPAGKPYDTELVDWLDLTTMLTVARCVASSALTRTESRGAHQREDYPGMDEAWRRNQVIA